MNSNQIICLQDLSMFGTKIVCSELQKILELAYKLFVMRMQFFILVRLLDLEESSRRKEIYFDPTLYIAADFDFAKLASRLLA